MSSNSPHIVIAGAGSVGCYVGGRLAHGGARVSFLARERIQNDIDLHGMKVSDWQGYSANLDPSSIEISSHDRILKDADIIIVSVKSRDTLAMAQTIKRSGNTTATIFSFQNGVGNVAVLKTELPEHTIMPVMVPYNVLYTPGSKNKAAHFHCGTEGTLFCQNDSASETLMLAAQQAGLAMEYKPNMVNILWSKLLLNLNNPINALAGIPLKQQLEDKHYRKIFRLAIQEGLAVLRSAGINPGQVAAVPMGLVPVVLALPTFLFKRVAQKMLAIDPEARSSMWEDLQNRRPVEVDYITGELVKLGQQVNVPTPVNSKLIELVKTAHAMGQGSPCIDSMTLLNQVEAEQSHV
ncbi:2-dehydropantoate 2-reductase [Bermanella marisrubri]|uniref:2-dehydropantoate 2-reductase n=1 Tax=Bermanella marisrubri TaxID=207949 RepID=Q1N209_9GAMM|nr:2-dehydropantoate 2-reductase [Bermanella marisrubri]EAT12355.1 2-dehydropantoate 2-reductase [Bermanella marisrubri]QIZ85438.1 2-dehydropantoate 2-reductase [Bermanella marisrubri]